jgi:uncharacterized membrane protein YcaP (DUF421 family)
MNSILRGVVTYVFVWLIFRIAGKRTLAQITTFDAVLLLIISETTQAALVDTDSSMTNSMLLILTMVGIDIVLSCLKRRSRTAEHIIDGTPLVLLDHQGLREHAMIKERVDEEDILNAARKWRGLHNMDEIEYAVLEQTGDIAIIPKQRS